MVNFKLGNEMRKVNRSTCHKNGTKKNFLKLSLKIHHLYLFIILNMTSTVLILGVLYARCLSYMNSVKVIP